MGTDNYGNKDLTLLLIGVGSIILSFFVAILGVIAGILGLIFAAKARRVHRSPLNTGAVICSLIGMILGLGSMVVMIATYIMAISA